MVKSEEGDTALKNLRCIIWLLQGIPQSPPVLLSKVVVRINGLAGVKNPIGKKDVWKEGIKRGGEILHIDEIIWQALHRLNKRGGFSRGTRTNEKEPLFGDHHVSMSGHCCKPQSSDPFHGKGLN